jgi:hypothetical protein
MSTHPALASPQLRVRRPVLRYHGGKFRLAPNLIALFPEHRVYTEVYGGGGSVLMLKPCCYSEIYNDLDGEVVNVFRVLQDRKKAARLEAALRVTPFARAEFELSYKHTRSEVERARRTIIRSFMGFGSDSISRMKASRAGFNTRISSVMSTGFRWNANRSGTTPATDWRVYPDCIPAFVARLQGVTIENRDARQILEKMDRPDQCTQPRQWQLPGTSLPMGNERRPTSGSLETPALSQGHGDRFELSGNTLRTVVPRLEKSAVDVGTLLLHKHQPTPHRSCLDEPCGRRESAAVQPLLAVYLPIFFSRSGDCAHQQKPHKRARANRCAKFSRKSFRIYNPCAMYVRCIYIF